MKVRFKRLHEDAVLPAYAKDGDAGMDVCCIDDGEVTHDYVQYKLGLAMEVPTGYVGLLFPRSSITKKDLMMKNSIGVIDSGYRGEVMARYKSDKNLIIGRYRKGDKVAQLIIIPIPKVEAEWADDLSDTDRGDGGFGSTGN